MNTTTTSLAFDASLPTRDVLLDAGAMGDHLARLMSVGGGRVPVTACRRVFVKYRYGDSLRIGYELTVDGSAVIVTARAFASIELAEKAAASARRVGAHECAHPTGLHDGLVPMALDAEHRAVWFTYPHDRRLVDLHAMDAPPPALRALTGDRWVCSELVQYAAERAATYRALDTDGATVAYVKRLRHREDVVDVADLYTSLVAGLREQGAVVGVPRALGYDESAGVIALEPMAGVGWNALDSAVLPGVASAIGAGLAAVHALPRLGRRVFERTAPDKVARSLEVLAEARPDVADEAAALGRRLVAARPAASAPAFLHGDLHPKNVLVDGEDVSLIDFDSASWGAPANDLGSMIARLHHGALLGEMGGGITPAIAEAFLAGHAGRGGPAVPLAELRWHTAAALVVERALRSVTRLHPGGLAALPATLAAASAALDSLDPSS